MIATHAVSHKPEMSAEALFRLGIAMSSQQTPNLVDAHKWFSLAAALGNEEAALLRKELALEMSDTEVTAAQRAARQWLTVH